MKTKLFRFSFGMILMLIACDGLQGPIGLTSLVNVVAETPGINCPSGGSKIETGIDDNNNMVLEPNEIDRATFICNGTPGEKGATGAPGLTSLIATHAEPAGTNCAAGGYSIQSGLDINGNSILDSSEITATSFICNGLNGVKSLISIVAEVAGANCPNGGYKIQTGLDTNSNGVLDASEAGAAKYVCHGKDVSTIPTAPSYTLSVHGKNNCILLNTSVAASTSISGGTQTVAVSGNAYFSPGASHKKVFIRYSGSDDDHLGLLTIGNTTSLGFRAGSLYAFYADWSDVNDNSGTASISFGSTTLPVHGKNNCILLDNSVAARINIPAGSYKVKVTGNAFFSPGATHYDVLVRYAGASDDELDILPIGGEKILNLRNGNGFYAFFADWDSINDNSGTVTLEFYKL